jgi:tRNA G10  N-methylase Trm11
MRLSYISYGASEMIKSQYLKSVTNIDTPKNELDQSEKSRINLLLRVWIEISAESVQGNCASFCKWAELIPDNIKYFFLGAITELKLYSEQSFNEKIIQIKLHNIPIVDFFANQLVNEEDENILKLRGAVYTPMWLANRVAKSALNNWKVLHRGGKQPKNIVDFSCGCGAFLLAAQKTFGPQVKIEGFDIDEKSINYSNLINWAFQYNWKLSNEDSLLHYSTYNSELFVEPTPISFNNKFDIILGNPPFIRSPNLDRDYSNNLRSRYKSISSGNFDISVAFIEHALESLTSEGIASYVLTNKFMTAEYGEKICSMIAKNSRILNIEDFHDSQIFPGYTTYTCVLTFAKKLPSKRFSITRFPGGIEPGRDPGKGEITTIPYERLLDHPWDFASGDIHDALSLLRDPKHPLIQNVFRNIQQGVRTGANDVYIIKSDDAISLESELLLPFVGGEQIRICNLNENSLRIIFPYRVKNDSVVVDYDEVELRNNFPKCYEYLSKNKEKLLDRSLDKMTPWYAFSRSQNMDLFQKPKLLIREMMPYACFAADFSGQIAFSSGYGLDASNMDAETLAMWTAIFCTPTMEFVLRHNGTQLHSGWFRLMKHHLVRTRLPYLSAEQIKSAKELSKKLHKTPEDKITLSKLNDLVAGAFNLNPTHLKVIETYLKDCHLRSKNALDYSSTSLSDIASEGESNKYEPVKLDIYNSLHVERFSWASLVTFRPNKKTPIHRWYQYTQGYSAELVKELCNELKIGTNDLVFDPFAGCGTTLLSCQQLGIPAVGSEISPVMAWVAEGKITKWDHDELKELIQNLKKPNCRVKDRNSKLGKSVFSDYLTKAYSLNILNQLEIYSESISKMKIDKKQKQFLLFGLIAILEDVSQIRKHGSHYRYLLKDENIGLQKLNIAVVDPESDIWEIFLGKLMQMLDDVKNFQNDKHCRSEVMIEDARHTSLEANSVSAVITSPPYLNRNNYIAQQKAELAVLNMISSKDQYKKLVNSTFRSHTEGKLDGELNPQLDEVQTLLNAIKLTKQNNPKIPHMISGYFDDITTTLAEIDRVLKPGGVCALVVGNTRWGGVVVPVDHLLMLIAEEKGFIPEKIIVTRLKGNSPQQMKQFGRIAVRESIVIFRKPTKLISAN